MKPVTDPNLIPSAGPSRRGSHRIDSWTCRRYFAYSQILHLQPVREPAGRALGALTHIGHMHHHLGAIGSEHAIDPFEAMRDAPARIAYTFPKAKEVLTAYITRYKDDTSVETLDVEREFEMHVGGHLHTQRIDRTVRVKRRGEWHVQAWDLKTFGGRPGGNPTSIAREWAMTTQFLSLEAFGRLVLPKIYDMPFGGLVVDSAGTIAPFSFSRPAVHVEPQMLRGWAENVASVNAEIDAEAERGTDPWRYRQNTKICSSGKYGACEYAALCLRGKAALGEFVTAVDTASEIET